MTTKPEVLGYCVKEDRKPWERSNSYYLSPNPDMNYTVPVIRLSDYEALQNKFEKLQADYEEELSRIRQDRDRHHGAVIRAVGQIATLQDEIEKLRKDAEFGRSVLSKREPGKAYGCHCDLEEGMDPDGCVIDDNKRHNCIYADDIMVKEECEYWRVIVSDAATQEKQS